MSNTGRGGNPPEHSRFKKGQSGNPKGRPRKVRTEPIGGSPFDIVFDRTLSVRSGGEEREVDVEEALLHKTLQDALSGSRPARRKIFKMIAKRETARAKRSARARPKYKPEPWKLEHSDPFEPNAAMLILGIAREDPRQSPADNYERLVLERWAIQAALARRHGKTALDSEAIADIKRCAHEPDKIVWPRGCCP